MTKTMILSTILGAALSLQGQALEEWDDLNVIQQNTEKPHSTMMTYPDEKEALSGDRTKSPWFQSLNGNWKFNWSKNPAARPAKFFETGFDDSAWKTIPVPSNWQMHGHGTPIYLNQRYPFKTVAPRVPREYNPVGSYRMSFTVRKAGMGVRH